MSVPLANHTAAVAPHYMHYDFAPVYRTLRVTHGSGVATHVWSIEKSSASWLAQQQPGRLSTS